MKVVNLVPFPVYVQRECLDDAFAVVDATTKVTYEEQDSIWGFAAEQTPVFAEGCATAPLGEIRYMRDEKVVDVTVIGDVLAHETLGFDSRELKLRVGAHERRLMVFGGRRWERQRGELRPSAIETVHRMPMTWERAYGGRIARPPGFLPGTTIPAPSTEIACTDNPLGMGFAFDEEAATGMSLPHIEDPDALVRQWSDRPKPRCWAPMPVNTSLRMDHLRLVDNRFKNRHGSDELLLARSQSNAPPELQLVGVDTGTAIRIDGFAAEPLSFEVPPPSFSWRVRTGTRQHRVRPVLAAIQLFPNERRVSCLYRTRLFAPLIQRETREAFQEASGVTDPSNLVLREPTG